MQKLPDDQHRMLERLFGVREPGVALEVEPIRVIATPETDVVGHLRCRKMDLLREMVVIGEVCVVPWSKIGRMALTVYLLSTLMFTTLFYGWGFGQLFLLGPAATTFYAVLFFMALLIFCNWWLARFRFGPAEWLWRSLTYMEYQSLRRQ